MEESSERTSSANSAEENTTNFCKDLDGKLLFSALYYKFMVTLNELKAGLKVSAQARQSDAVNETSVESKAQDDDEDEMNRHVECTQGFGGTTKGIEAIAKT
jgi:hypothetical protein